jgi:murein DD-endopeptidase MepM/ murein hydrolase activator NlpD
VALSAAAAAALKKLAAATATDKNVAKTIGGIVLGVLLLLVTPVLAILAIFQGGAQLDITALTAQAQNEQLAYFEQVMLAIEDEISAQGLELDPIKAQVIYLCALQGREREDSFYTIYIGCFAREQDAYAAIGETFGVSFREEDIEKIEQLIGLARQAQTGPSNNLHARILELTADDATPLPEGDFLSPLHGQDWKPLITSGFGMRIHPISGERKFHSGLDLSLPEGTPLYPAQVGRVLIAGSDSSYGNYVVVYHGGGMATLYAHCSRILVSEELEVTTETMIARSGDTGASTGPHLHIEFVEAGIPVNPKIYLQKTKG